MRSVGISEQVLDNYENEIAKINGLDDIYYIVAMMVENFILTLSANKNSGASEKK